MDNKQHVIFTGTRNEYISPLHTYATSYVTLEHSFLKSSGWSLVPGSVWLLSDTTEAQKRFFFFFFLNFKKVSCLSYLNVTRFICHMSCVKLYPVVLPGGQTEGLRGPRSCKFWQQTAAFTLGKQRENREKRNVSVVNSNVSFPMCSANPFQLGF